MVERLVHVLIQGFVGWVEDAAFLLMHVHQEAIFGHVVTLLCWWTEDRQT